MSISKLLCSITALIVLLAGSLLGTVPVGADAPLDFDLPDGTGHFYRQASGQVGGEAGFAITNADGVSFWDDYQRLGGPEALGYPASRRFVWDGFAVQVMQKVVFQWRPETKTVAFANVFDRLHDLGQDGWLEVFRSTPPPFDTKPDTGLTGEQVRARHLQMLDQNPAIKEVYLAAGDPLLIYGLPMSYQDYSNVFVIRAQRAVFQQWKEDVPWAKKGQVLIANGGDVAKDAGIFPGEAVTPELPPGSSQPIAPPCSTVPLRGFGKVWSDHPELYDLIGCPAYPIQEQALSVNLQPFEHGWMLWVNAAGPGWYPAGPQIYVLFDDNQTFTSFPDNWTSGKDPVSTGLTPPPGLLEPERGFGKVWREGTGVKTQERLGWATGPERPGQGAWQSFQRGRMVWTPDPRLIFVLAERTPKYEVLNAWRIFQDTFNG